MFVEDVGVSIENAFRLDRKGDRSNLAGQVGGNLSNIYPHIFISCALILPLFAICSDEDTNKNSSRASNQLNIFHKTLADFTH